ncbi:MAG: OmpA family protein [Rhodospirillales bacterium]|nr:OmpA family protein [Rhodospirillales bacterium]MDE2391077.1 OmpA family protein [Rhodospirillales bacterium]
MKIPLWLPCVLALIPARGFAQVTVNPAALRQLEGLSPLAPAAKPEPAMVRPVIHKPHLHLYHRATPQAPRPLTPAKPANPAPSVKPTPAPKPVLPEPSLPPIARIEFAPGSATLSAEAMAALKPFCTASAPVPVVARAPADPNDPSSAMRLSLNRAFAIRDALTACGVAASLIIPRAAGSAPGADDNEALIGASATP